MPREKRRRASPIKTVLTPEIAAMVKGMVARGDRQSDICALFQINQGRVAEINAGKKFRSVVPALPEALPEPGPYITVQKARHTRAAIAEEILNRLAVDLQRALDAIRSEGVDLTSREA